MKANPARGKATDTCPPALPDPLQIGIGFQPDGAFAAHCKQLARARLAGPVARLFVEQTGTPLRVIWAPDADLKWNESSPLFHTTACPNTPCPVPPDHRCVHTDHCQLSELLASDESTREFVCHGGIRTVTRRIHPADFLLGVAFFQLRDEPSQGNQDKRLRRHRNLLRFVVHDVEETVLAMAGREIIDRLRDELTASRNEETHLRSIVHRLVPSISDHSAPEELHSHSEILVSRMLDHANKNYSKPIGLDELAREWRMNLSYLSHLFSTSMGIPFRSYVKQLRMDRARELLSEPLLRISDIAYSVGYTDPNRFRLDFKEHTGLAPTRWRARQEMAK